MSETDIYHPDVVRAFAAAWASIDGKLEVFEREEVGPMPRDTPGYTGHYEGYMVEAQELLERAGNRLRPTMDLWELLSPPNPQESELDDIKAKLCVGEFSSFSVTWNDYSAPNYMSVADGFEEDAGSDSHYFSDDSFVGGAEEKKRCAEMNSIWTAHWYPQTPVGFSLLHASTFERLMEGLREEAKPGP